MASSSVHDFPRIFDHLVSGSSARFRSSEPRVDVVESPKTTTFLCNLPGVKRSEVEITIHEGVLTVSGTYGHPHAQPNSSIRVEVEERAQGPFHRAFRVPRSLKGNEVTATMEDGVLTIEFDKKVGTETEGEKVEIQ